MDYCDDIIIPQIKINVFGEINMNLFKKITAAISAFILIFAFFLPCFSASAAVKATEIKILQLPVKTVIYEEDDWVYGTWDVDEDRPHEPFLLPSTKISFTHNPCGGIYPTRGMLDMTGLVIEVYYSDGSKKEMTYTEALNKNGYYQANILVSPKGGKEYFVGTNTMVVYLAEKTCFADFEVEFVSKENKPYFGVKEGSTAAINSRGYITGLSTSLSAKQLLTEFLDYKNVEVSVSKVSSSYKFYGTGSTVNVKYPDGHEELYTVIIYGDVDGNAVTDSADTALISNYLSGSTLNSVQLSAANVDGMRNVSASDLVILATAIISDGINQVSPSVSK